MTFRGLQAQADRPATGRRTFTVMSLPYIRERYGVPVKRGQRVTHGKDTGTVTSGRGAHVRVRFDGRNFSVPCHPLSLDYGDGVDPEARTARQNERIDVWNDRLNDRISGEEYVRRMNELAGDPPPRP